MNINRHNYEAFFLLYVDKELSAADRKAVAVFVKENTDLQIELALLQYTVVKSDDIVLDKKDWLYREENITALQENLLLYADEELSATDKKTIEYLLLIDKTAQREWKILQQTKLQPDTAVVFADKQSLYRKEGSKVVGFTWWRVAAAAVLLGFGLWTGVAVYKNNFAVKPNSAELVKGENTKKKQTDLVVPTNVTTVFEEKTPTDNVVITISNNKTSLTEKIINTVEKIKNENTLAAKQNVTVHSSNNKKPDNNLLKSSLQNINRSTSNETIVANVPALNNNNRVSVNNDAVVKTNPKENTNNMVIASLNTNKAQANTTAVQVANNTTADEENNDRYLNVDDDKEKRTALGGFLRKAKRVIERTTNLKTGEGVKIAGFEIALK